MTTSILGSLKAIARPEIIKSPVLAKRMKLIERLEEQLAMATAQLTSQPFTAYKTKTVNNPESGEKTKINVPRKIRPWYFENAGHYYMEVKFEGKTWEVQPEKPTIDIGELANLPEILKIVLSAAEKGELDTFLLIESKSSVQPPEELPAKSLSSQTSATVKKTK